MLQYRYKKVISGDTYDICYYYKIGQGGIKVMDGSYIMRKNNKIILSLTYKNGIISENHLQAVIYDKNIVLK